MEFFLRFLVIFSLLIYIGNTQNDAIVVQSWSIRNDTETLDVDDSSRFPDYFKFGVATAAYQIEGGWNADCKGPSIWDTLTHEHPERVVDHSTGDIGPDSYHLYEQDVEKIKSLGVQYYRFSVSWSRVLPTGDISSLNLDGIQYYNKLIDLLITNGVEPMITMYHYDLPQAIQDLGGLINPIFVRYFEQYAQLLFTHFADRVKLWITFNEPSEFCISGYGTGQLAPLINSSGIGEYYCSHHTLLAHAHVYHLYKKFFYPKYKGKIGITLNARYFYRKNTTTNDNDDGEDLVERAIQFKLGWYAHPIFSSAGGYPAVMVETITKNSMEEGRAWSRMPILTEIEKKIIKGSADFVGLNYYTSRYVEPVDQLGPNPSWERDLNVKLSIDNNWPQSKSSWLYSVPEGLGGLLRWIRDEYNNPELIITENGWSDDGELEDIGRVTYLKAHLKVILDAIHDGCNVTGYTAWSLIDNFEWLQGYTEKFGLYRVDINDPTKQRIPKKSAIFYKELVKTRQLLN